jgi:acyl-CoA synthetase (NDP forming)
VVIAFIEGIRSPQRFMAAARAMRAAGKPLLVVKVGRSESARQAVQAHTGSLAGSDAVVDAVFRRLGVVRLDTLDELLEAAELFSTAPLPSGKGIGLLSLSGGQIGLVADLAEELALDFPDLSAPAQAELARILPPFSPIANPLDAWGSGDLENTYPACVEVVAREDAVHLVAVSRDTPPQVAPREVEQSLAVAQAAVRARERTGKPVVVFSNVSSGFHPEATRVLRDGAVPYLQGTRETLKVIKAFTDYGEARRMLGVDEPLQPGPHPERELWRERLRQAQGSLSEVEGRRLLAAYGIPGPREGVAQTANEAVAIADSIGYPVVLKILSPDILHKTEIGGVRVGLADGEAVEDAFRQVMDAAGQHHPSARMDGALVQEMVVDGVEVILGLLRDPDFGPAVLYGSGGILVELLRDSSLRLPPLTRAQALAMIDETKGARLLRGFRGRPAADVDGLADALLRLSQLALDLGDLISALDINPLVVLPAGQGVLAVDALVEVG